MILKCGGAVNICIRQNLYTKRAIIQIIQGQSTNHGYFYVGETNQGDDCFDVQPRGKKKSSVPLFI